ncbi:unnamed protein product, partial (macronuclear) [Paramecium tetraurelia]
MTKNAEKQFNYRAYVKVSAKQKLQLIALVFGEEWKIKKLGSFVPLYKLRLSQKYHFKTQKKLDTQKNAFDSRGQEVPLQNNEKWESQLQHPVSERRNISKPIRKSLSEMKSLYICI